jgi:copper oxidase (laccase) domain-containing protein
VIERVVWSTPAGDVCIVASTRPDGDFHLDSDPVALERRRRALVDLPWTMLDEVHGTDVVEVVSPGAADRVTGDVALSRVPGAVLGVWVGDCAPIVVGCDDGWLATIHAGWRGLAGEVVEVALGALDDRGASPRRRALLGPCIHPCCYEFGHDDLARVAAGVGAAPEVVAGSTRWGSLALDVPAAVTAAFERRGVAVERVGGCTGCDDRWFSHRVRGERERHVVAVWREAP